MFQGLLYLDVNRKLGCLAHLETLPSQKCLFVAQPLLFLPSYFDHCMTDDFVSDFEAGLKFLANNFNLTTGVFQTNRFVIFRIKFFTYRFNSLDAELRKNLLKLLEDNLNA